MTPRSAVYISGIECESFSASDGYGGTLNTQLPRGQVDTVLIHYTSHIGSVGSYLSMRRRSKRTKRQGGGSDKEGLLVVGERVHGLCLSKECLWAGSDS